MHAEQFVTWRYLRGVQGQVSGKGFLRFITFVAIGGVTVGVATLLLALAIVRGFGSEIQQKVMGFGAHIQVETFQDAPIARVDTLMDDLQAFPEVVAVYPVVQELALLKTRKDVDGVGIWGTQALYPYLRMHLTAGTEGVTDTLPAGGAIVGKHLADRMGLAVGDVMVVFALRNQRNQSFYRLRPRAKRFKVVAIYETGLVEFDDLYVFVPIQEARELLGYQPDEVTRLDLLVREVSQAREIAQHLEATLGFPFIVRSVFEIYRNLFAWIRLQQSIVPLVIGVLIIIAAVNIMGILLMIVLEKSREIGVLASLGLSRRRIRRLFVLLGLAIGGIGVSLGSILALLLGGLQQRYALIRLPQEVYFINKAPIAFALGDFIWVALIALLLCGLAAYIPARIASRISPVAVIRWMH